MQAERAMTTAATLTRATSQTMGSQIIGLAGALAFILLVVISVIPR
jgi:hypothetical protein